MADSSVLLTFKFALLLAAFMVYFHIPIIIARHEKAMKKEGMIAYVMNIRLILSLKDLIFFIISPFLSEMY